ncbi:MAG: HNH endonuclease [Rhizobium sp.]|nr:HNH endonuclease [Rhizobium sp.]
MECIFCRKARAPSVEHVFPKAIGGALTFSEVCKECNDALGSEVDATLTNWPSVLLRRAELGLAGYKGRITSPSSMLTGRHILIDDDGNAQPIVVVLDKASDELRCKILPSRQIEIDQSGVKVLKISADPDDLVHVGKWIQEARLEAGLEPLSALALASEVEKIAREEKVIQNPLVQAQLKAPAMPCLALGKIAYELAYLWLGHRYLGDQIGTRLKEAIQNPLSPEIQEFVQYAMSKDSALKPGIWRTVNTRHSARAFRHERRLLIYIKIFQVIEAFVTVSETAEQYGSYPDDDSYGYIILDAGTGSVHQSSWQAEITRLVGLMSRFGRGVDLPDALDGAIGHL